MTSGNLHEVSRFLIYGLIDPRTQELRYVGKSCSGMKRPLAHARWSSEMAKSPRRHVMCWIRQLRAAGLEPEIVVLEEHVLADKLEEAEVFFIAYFRMLGCRLTNHTAGGDGRAGSSPSSETRAKLAAALRGRHRPASATQAVRDLALARRGTFMSVESRRKMVRAHGGRPVVDERDNRHDGIGAAARFWNLNPGSVWQVLNGESRQAGGHVFRYLEAA